MTSNRRWAAAGAEHDRVVREFLDALQRIPQSRWQDPPAPGKWSPATLALHVCQSYEFGRDAVAGGPGMRLRVSPLAAQVSRTLLLPLFLASKQFPRGAKAPAEVVPDQAEAGRLTPDAAALRLQRVADEASVALRRAAHERSLTVTHAYFGALKPYPALRLLSAHTRHHARGLARLTADESQPW